MARFIFFLLLIAVVGFGAYIYLNETAPHSGMPAQINPEAIRIVSVADPSKAQADALAARRMAASLNGAACLDFGVKPADAGRTQVAFAAMKLGDRLTNRNVEEFSRYAVSLPAQKDKKTADTLVANLKKAGVKDVSALGDNAISLGVYSSEDAANKAAAEIKTKAAALVKDIVVTPRNGQIRESIFTVREPDLNLVARLTIMQREFEGSSLKAVACAGAAPITPPVAAVTVQENKTPEKAKP